MLKLSTKLKRSDEVIASKMDDEVVMMSVEQGMYFGLDPIAADIWDVLESKKTVKEIIEAMVKKYDVDKATCKKDVLQFLRQMQKNNLVSEA